MVRSSLIFAVLVLLFLGGIHSRQKAQRVHLREQPPQLSYLPDREVLDVLSLGYKTFLADMIWVRTLQYRERGNPRRLVPQYADAIIHLDPEFKPIYKWAATTLVFARGSAQDNIRKANHYLELGAKQFPKDPNYYYTMGVNWAFYYPAKDKEERAIYRRKAIEAFQFAMQRPNSPRGIPLLISGLLTYDGDEAKLAFLRQAYWSESDPQARRVMELRLRELGGDATDRLIERKRRLQKHWRKSNFDYLPEGLALFVGERMSYSPVD